MRQFVVAVGDPFEGVTLYGPWNESEFERICEDLSMGGEGSWAVVFLEPGSELVP